MKIREYRGDKRDNKEVEIYEHNGDPYQEPGEALAYLIPEARGRMVIEAYACDGFHTTAVDLQDVIDWVKENKPEMLK